jgi:hypothetical protein
MRECPSEVVVALVLEDFSEETREAIVEDILIAPRLVQGIAQCRQSSQDLDAAMADILADERQRVGRRALGRFVGVGYRHAEGSSTIVNWATPNGGGGSCFSIQLGIRLKEEFHKSVIKSSHVTAKGRYASSVGYHDNSFVDKAATLFDTGAHASFVNREVAAWVEG